MGGRGDRVSALRIAVATGAGISAESGLPTFRDAGGLWEGRRPEEVATPGAFARDPVDVWNFYLFRRRSYGSVMPNAGHRAIASWQERFGEVPVITQNVDGLHQSAGSTRVLELHGSIWRRHCHACGRAQDDRALELEDGAVPRCACGGSMRPSVVWFGESLPEGVFDEARAIVESVDLLFVVGTSNLVYPAASLPLNALAAGVKVVEVNPGETPLSSRATRFIRGPAAAILPGIDPGEFL